MKKYLTLPFFVFLFAYNAHAQTMDVYYLGRTRVALVLVTHSKEYLLDENYFKLVKEKWIKEDIWDIIKPNPNDTLKYGHDAKNGVHKIILDDKRYPNAYLKLINGMTCVWPPDSVKVLKH